MDLSLTEMWGQMGWFVKGIVLVMIAMSVITISVAVAKWRTLARMSRETRAFAPKFSEALEGERIQDALALTEQQSRVVVWRQEPEAGRRLNRRLAEALVELATTRSAVTR